MPYIKYGPLYSQFHEVTKRMVFSAWSGVPTSVASLLSYAADRNIAAASRGFLSVNTSAARIRVAERFTYRLRAGEVGALQRSRCSGRIMNSLVAATRLVLPELPRSRCPQPKQSGA